jgi:hypothetical protein
MSKSFNESNVTRPRYRVWGRVIVATTAVDVEFLSEDLRQSFPLWNYATNYSPAIFPRQQMLVFVFEGQGYLTFGPSASPEHELQIKIQDVGEFTRFDYNPQLFNLVEVVDPYTPLVLSSYKYRYSPADYPTRWVVSYERPGGSETVELQCSGALVTAEVWQQTFAVGSPWKGIQNYPGFQLGMS